MRLVGYIRVSRVAGREGESFISPDDQREQVKSYVHSRGHQVIEWHTDLDQSGAKEGRPALDAALAQIRSGEAEGLIVAKLDRLTRSLVHLGKLMEEAKRDGWNLIAVDMGLDFKTPNGKLVANVLGTVAEWQLDRIRENWGVARGSAIGRGTYISNVPPLGYARGAGGRLEPDPRTAHIVRELFDRRGNGQSLRSLCDFLDERLRREKAWPVSTVTSILSNRVYLGQAKSGEFVNPNAHQPLVSRAQWERAQAVPMARSRNGNAGALLTGIIRCASCGGPMTPGSDGSRGYKRYDCQRRGSADHTPSAVSMRNADAYAERIFLDWLNEEAPISVEARAANEKVEQALEALEREEQNLADFIALTDISEIGADTYTTAKRERVKRVEGARAQLAEAQRELPVKLGRQELLGNWDRLTTSEKRTILAAAFDSVYVSRAHTPGKGTPIADRVAIRWRDD